MLASTMWKILSIIFFTIGIVAGLGEWVFHWWESPGDWMSPLGIVLGLASFAFSASSAEVERSRREQAARFDRTDGFLRESLGGQERLVHGQERLVQGQIEQTGLLRQVVDSFRGRVP